VALALSLGADDALDGRRGDIVAAARRFAPDGTDAVLGLAGGDGLERCLDTLRRGGRCAYPNGVEPEPKNLLEPYFCARGALLAVNYVYWGTIELFS
jgi:NADPH:quinone reductase